MKDHIPLLPLAVTVLCLCGFAACGDTEPYGHRETLPANGTAPETATETDELYARYDALIRALRQELAELHTDTALTTETLRLRIDALEAALESLGAELPAVTVPSDPSGTQTHPPVATTTPLPESEEPFDTERESAVEVGTETGGHAQPPASDGSFFYTVTDGTVTITGCREDIPSHLVIPATLGGLPVTRIADNAFAGTDVELVALPATLTHIGWFAFADCRSLRTVTLPLSVAHIDYGAFDGCPRLTLYCPRDSYTARYAAASAIPYVEV